MSHELTEYTITAKIAYMVKCAPCLLSPNKNNGIFKIIRNIDNDIHSGVSWDNNIAVPEIPLSYNMTGAINTVTPKAFITPAINRNTNFLISM